MKKLIVIVLLLISNIAFAQEEWKVEALQEAMAAGYDWRNEVRLSEPKASYSYGCIYPYQASQGEYWSGLALTNISTYGGIQCKIMVLDANGVQTGSGEFYLANFNSQKVGQLKDLVTVGYLPSRGALYIYSTGPFMADLLIGNSKGGFSVTMLESLKF